VKFAFVGIIRTHWGRLASGS